MATDTSGLLTLHPHPSTPESYQEPDNALVLQIKKPGCYVGKNLLTTMYSLNGLHGAGQVTNSRASAFYVWDPTECMHPMA